MTSVSTASAADAMPLFCFLLMPLAAADEAHDATDGAVLAVPLGRGAVPFTGVTGRVALLAAAFDNAAFADAAFAAGAAFG